jgi:hypothetical protein
MIAGLHATPLQVKPSPVTHKLHLDSANWPTPFNHVPHPRSSGQYSSAPLLYGYTAQATTVIAGTKSSTEARRASTLQHIVAGLLTVITTVSGAAWSHISAPGDVERSTCTVQCPAAGSSNEQQAGQQKVSVQAACGPKTKHGRKAEVRGGGPSPSLMKCASAASLGKYIRT